MRNGYLVSRVNLGNWICQIIIGSSWAGLQELCTPSVWVNYPENKQSPWSVLCLISLCPSWLLKRLNGHVYSWRDGRLSGPLCLIWILTCVNLSTILYWMIVIQKMMNGNLMCLEILWTWLYCSARSPICTNFVILVQEFLLTCISCSKIHGFIMPSTITLECLILLST
jgi:hypothetical protein